MQQDYITKDEYAGYENLLKMRINVKKEIDDKKDTNLEKFFIKLGSTAFTTLCLLILLSMPLNIYLTPSLTVISFLIPSIVYGIKLGIKNIKTNQLLKEAENSIKFNYSNLNFELTNEQLENILNNVNIINENENKDVIDFNIYLNKQNESYIEAYDKPKVRKLTR